MGKKCIATHIDNEDLYQKAFIMEVDAMEGTYVAEQMFTTVHTSSYLQSNFFRLMVAITKDEPDVVEIEQIISMDAMLTYSLLKIVNSAYFALRNRATEVHQAVTILGLGQLRQWIYLMGTTSPDAETDATNEEFLKTSFMRATFSSELLKFAKDMPISRNEAYLMGMFSTLGYLIAAPLEEILALSYERADWSAISELAETLAIPVNLLTNTYFQCLEEVNGIWRQLMETNDGADAPPPPGK